TTGSAVLDLNGDGLPDIARNESGSPADIREVALNTGTQFSPYSIDHGFPYRVDDQPGEGFRPSGTDFVDINGDGFIDQVFHNEDATGATTLSGVYLNQASLRDVLTHVTNGFGVTAEIVYAPLNERDAQGNALIYEKGSGTSGELMDMTGSMYVVEEVKHEDGAGGQYSMEYRYGGLRTHRLRGSAGFEWVSTLDTRTDIVSTTTFAQEFPFTGMPVDSFTQTEGGAGVTLSETTTIYDRKPLNDGKTWLVFAKSSSTTTRDLDGSIVAETSTITQRGALGQTDDYDEYGNSLHIEADLDDGYSKVTINTYDNTVSADKWHLGRLTRSEVASIGPNDPAPGLERVSEFTYDSGTGLLKTETIEPDFESTGTPEQRRTWMRTTYGYDDFGNKETVTIEAAGYDPQTDTFDAPVSRATTTQFDAFGRLPEWAENALGHRQTFLEYFQGLGIAKSVKGPNELVTHFEIDGFGRVTKETRPDTTISEVRRRWVSGNAPAGALYYIETTATGAAPTVEFFDAFGRSIRKLGVDGDGFAVAADTAYDAMGRAASTSTSFRT
ncbi:MAG: toxin TcdB middle/N-terminal domain-containing protein, partial [Opitutaceae bacterium]